ncbi:MAG: hypothetical protein MUE72_06330 [Chitinophagaceae bacterium]|jgi:hypothetical protein|nr:hypothetical protein [Chitinophagaceae bacterium]
MNLNKLPLKTIIIIFMIVLPLLSIAQPSFDDDVEDVPIDGGLSLLIAGGIGIAAKKMKGKKSTAE